MTKLKIEHPGVILREEYLDPLGITQTELARQAGISYLRVNELVNGKRGITPDTAMRLARCLGTTAEFWMNWQVGYDLRKVKATHRAEYDRIPRFAAGKAAR